MRNSAGTTGKRCFPLRPLLLNAVRDVCCCRIGLRLGEFEDWARQASQLSTAFELSSKLAEAALDANFITHIPLLTL